MRSVTMPVLLWSTPPQLLENLALNIVLYKSHYVISLSDYSSKSIEKRSFISIFLTYQTAMLCAMKEFLQFVMYVSFILLPYSYIETKLPTLFSFIFDIKFKLFMRQMGFGPLSFIFPDVK